MVKYIILFVPLKFDLRLISAADFASFVSILCLPMFPTFCLLVLFPTLTFDVVYDSLSDIVNQ